MSPSQAAALVLQEEVEPPLTSPLVGDHQPVGARTGATLVEQHGDLLSFIARKERRCLDLRGELQRHEDELKDLKAKWEAIVARDLRTSPRLGSERSNSASSPPMPSPALSGHRRRFANARHSIAGTPSTLLSDLGLPIDPSHPIDGGQPAALPDMNAAKRWMGGLVKSATAGVSGILEGLAAPPPSPSVSSC